MPYSNIIILLLYGIALLILGLLLKNKYLKWFSAIPLIFSITQLFNINFL